MVGNYIDWHTIVLRCIVGFVAPYALDISADLSAVHIGAID